MEPDVHIENRNGDVQIRHYYAGEYEVFLYPTLCGLHVDMITGLNKPEPTCLGCILVNLQEREQKMTNEEAVQEILAYEKKLWPMESILQRYRDAYARALGVHRLFRREKCLICGEKAAYDGCGRCLDCYGT